MCHRHQGPGSRAQYFSDYGQGLANHVPTGTEAMCTAARAPNIRQSLVVVSARPTWVSRLSAKRFCWRAPHAGRTVAQNRGVSEADSGG